MCDTSVLLDLAGCQFLRIQTDARAYGSIHRFPNRGPPRIRCKKGLFAVHRGRNKNAFSTICRAAKPKSSDDMVWESAHSEVLFAEVRSGKHTKASGKENLAAACAAAAKALQTLRPGTTAKQCIEKVRFERAQAQVFTNPCGTVRHSH